MSEGYEIFIGWIEKYKGEIDSGQEVTVTVKDLDTFAKVGLRGKISKSKEGLKSAVPLRVVTDMGEKMDQMYIQVTQELDDIAAVETG